jgi:uncharacterized protein
LSDDDAAASAPPPAIPIPPAVDPGPPPRPYPAIGQAVVLLLLFAAFAVGGGVFTAIATKKDSLARFLANGAFLVGALGAVAYVGFRRSGEPADRVFPLRPFSPRFLPALIVLLAGSLLLVAGLNVGLEKVWPKPASLREMERHLIGGEGSLTSALLVVAILGPIAEELLFRGVILQGFLRNYGARKAILASAALFALYHLNPWQMPLALVLGVLFGVWRVGTGSLWPSIVGHALTNSVPVMVAARSHHPARSAPDGSAVAWIFATALILLWLGDRLWRRARPSAA